MKKHYFKDSWFYRYIWSAVTHPKNFFFLCKYPFWKMRNVWTRKFVGYDYTEYECIETGWRKAFGKELTADIVKALKSDGIPKRKWEENVYWEQIKEKWGSLCLYCVTTEKVLDALDKYERMSKDYCMLCGKPAKYMTLGYTTYICEDCKNDYLEKHPKLSAEDLVEEIDKEEK